MKFNDAFEKAIEAKEKSEGADTGVSPQTAKILALIWSMIAISKNKLDDLVYIDENNKIVSLPLPVKDKDDEKKTTGQKSKSSNKTAQTNKGTKSGVEDNGQGKEPTE